MPLPDPVLVGTMSNRLILPEGFDEYAWEVEAKGVLFDAAVRVNGRNVAVTFYDPTRLAQDIASDLDHQKALTIKRLLVVDRVTLDSMQAAVDAAPQEFFE
jgi:hypothetical protein